MKRVSRFLVLGFGVLVASFLALTIPSKTEATLQDACGPVLQLPSGSKVTPEGDGMRITYPDNSAITFNCHCDSGSGDCTEASSGTDVYCKKLDGCTDCHAHISS